MLRLFALPVFALFVACSPGPASDPVSEVDAGGCVEGDKEPCRCPTGRVGWLLCNDADASWSECWCPVPPDSGVDG